MILRLLRMTFVCEMDVGQKIEFDASRDEHWRGEV